ncbi:MAG: alkaline phosphatase family protein, partial [Nisaea sp.]
MARPRFLFVLFDGLRRDMVRPDTAPAIHGFRQSWTDFPNSASVFPVETRVQVSSFVTGSFPGPAALHPVGDGARPGHGIMGNTFYDPSLGFDGPMDTSDDVKMAEAARRYGRLQGARNTGEILHEAGLKYGVVTTGKIGNARLLNLNAADHGQPVFSIWGADISSPAADFDGVIERHGPVPDQQFPNVDVQNFAATVLLDEFIPKHDADVQVIWFNEPDLSFHYREIGSPDSLTAIKAVDDAFRRILDWWEAKGREEGWQIIAASDHGQITATGQINVAEELTKAGFRIGT